MGGHAFCAFIPLWYRLWRTIGGFSWDVFTPHSPASGVMRSYGWRVEVGTISFRHRLSLSMGVNGSSPQSRFQVPSISASTISVKSFGHLNKQLPQPNGAVPEKSSCIFPCVDFMLCRHFCHCSFSTKSLKYPTPSAHYLSLAFSGSFLSSHFKESSQDQPDASPLWCVKPESSSSKELAHSEPFLFY